MGIVSKSILIGAEEENGQNFSFKTQIVFRFEIFLFLDRIDYSNINTIQHRKQLKNAEDAY